MAAGNKRVLRGGSWGRDAVSTSARYHYQRGLGYRSGYFGFRVVVPALPVEKVLDSDKRVLRGGSWYGVVDFPSARCRGGFNPDVRYDYVGFRVVVETKTP